VDGGVVEIAAHVVWDLDADGRRLQAKKFTEYTAESVRSMYPSATELRAKWSAPDERATIIAALEERGISFDELAEAAKQPDADPFDLLCHVAYSAPIRSRRERAEAARNDGAAFFGRFTNGAREVLNELLEKYVEFGTAQFQIPDILKVPPLSQHGNVIEIAEMFGGPEQLRTAVGELQQLLYAA
jgi:type I restriction enzyme R subunit